MSWINRYEIWEHDVLLIVFESPIQTEVNRFYFEEVFTHLLRIWNNEESFSVSDFLFYFILKTGRKKHIEWFFFFLNYFFKVSESIYASKLYI